MISTLERTGTIELGNFRILGLLGEGSFAAAFLAEQLGTERRAVVKIAHRHLILDRGVDVVKARFLDEVRASTRVQHPNLATVFTAGETRDGLPAIAMEFVPGDSLEAYLERSAPLRPRELSFFAQLASVLTALHHVNIVHRDVSPSNIIISRDYEGKPRAKLLDFGIAQQTRVSSPSSAMGTPRYAAPEQIVGEAVPASDLYGLGATLWWALTGLPYLHELKSLDEILSHPGRLGAAPDPRIINPDVPPSLANITRALLDPAPSKRPTSRELLDLWPSIVGDARAWRRRRRGASASVVMSSTVPRALRLLVIDPHPIKRHLVADFAERLGCEITIAEHPRQATRGELGEFDVAILTTELDGVDAAAVGRHLREHFPDQRLLLMSSKGERLIDCAAAGADIHLTLPGELSRLAEYLETFQQRTASGGAGTPIRTLDGHEPVSHVVIEDWKTRPRIELTRAIELYVGDMPNLIAQLDGLCTKDSSCLWVCDTIKERSKALGAQHLARLAQALRMLVEADELPDPDAYVRELESEYMRVFRQLLQILNQS